MAKRKKPEKSLGQNELLSRVGMRAKGGRNIDSLIIALETLVGTIEATGGVVHDRKGLYQPAADREWIDLGDAYVQACRALGREPKLAEDDEDDDDELPTWARREA